MAFWIPANMPCSHVIPNVRSAQMHPLHISRPREKEREREGDLDTGHWELGFLYFILPNEQTSCPTRKQMALLVSTFSCSFFACPSSFFFLSTFFRCCYGLTWPSAQSASQILLYACLHSILSLQVFQKCSTMHKCCSTKCKNTLL